MDTKTALLDSAENAIKSKGFDGFSYADLAEEVGIRKASIHYHFPTKGEMALRLMQRYYESLIAHLSAIDANSSSAGQRLKAQIDRYRAAMGDGSKLCLCVAFSVSAENIEQGVIEQLTQFRSTSVSWLSTVFEAGIVDGTIAPAGEPAGEAAACLACLEGAHLVARAQGDVSRFDEAVQFYTNRIVG